MEATILKLSKQSDRQPLLNYVAERSEEEILKTVRSCLDRNGTSEDIDPLLLLRGLLLGLPLSRDETCITKRAVIIKETAKWLCEVQGDASNSKLSSSIVTYLLPELETLSKENLSDIANKILDCVENGKQLQSRVFEILSKIWNLLVATQRTEYTNAIFQKIKSTQWSAQTALGIAAGINDMDLAGSQLEQMTQKMISQLEILDIDELPPYIYQLLLLSRKGQKRAILQGICEHFNRAESKRSKDDYLNTSYVRMEGTVMLHITFAIKQDQELGQELLKMMRQGKIHALQMFPIATLLSAARIHRLEDVILDSLKGTISAIYRDNEKLKQFTWMPDYAKVDAAYIEETFLSIAEKSAAGWDQLTQPLAQLGILLIESTVNQSGWGKSKATQQKPLVIDGVTALGIRILLRLFQQHSSLRSEILDQITSRIISRSESAPQFINLLENVVSDQPRAIEPYLSNIRDTLNYLSYLPYTTADSLLQAIQPLGNIDDSFRDGLMLVLRKCMFAKDVDGRKVAVNGFLDLLWNQVWSEDQPQGSSSTLRKAGVAFEILGLLRRCLGQQGEIRAVAYEGLHDISHNDLLISDIFEILYNQFGAVYETDVSIPVALRLEASVENVNTARCPILLEPVHVLLSNLFKIIRRLEKTEQNAVIAKSLASCQEAASSLIFRLAKADLEDYELDKTANYDRATFTGVKNNLYASILLGCYEVAMEHEYSCRAETYESFEKIDRIFKKRCALQDVLKEFSTDERGRKLVVDYPTMLSLDFTASITEKMFADGDRQTPVRAVRADLNFVQYIVTVTQQCLENAISRKRRSSGDEAIFKQCLKLCNVYKHILLTEGSDSSFVGHSPKKGTSLLGAIVDGLRNILDTVARVWPEKMDELLLNVFPRNNGIQNVSHNAAILSAFEFFKKILLKYINDPPPLYKEAAIVIQVLASLVSNLSRNSEDYAESVEEIKQWLENFVKERPLEEVGLVKELITLFIKLCTEVDDFLTVTYIAQDLHALHGDIEVPADSQEVPDEELSVQYQMMNEKTCGPVSLLLLSSLEHWLDDLNWAIGRLKQYASSVTDDEDSSVADFEQLICKRIQSCLNVLSEFTKAVLLGPHAEALIRVLSKTYKLLLSLVKYTMIRPQQMSSDFVLVIQIAGTNITDKMYKFLTIYGQQHMDYLEAGLKKGKGKKGGGSSKEKAKILRESKTIPNLIFLVEQFERHLIQLTRKSKVDLMQYMKRSTARDFKIKLDLIQDAEQTDNVSENEKSMSRTSSSGASQQSKRRAPNEKEDRMDLDDSDSRNENPNRNKRQRNT